MRFTTYEPWAIEPLSELVQQALEFGLMTHFFRKSKRIVDLANLKEPEKYNIDHLMTSISMKQLYFLFIFYAIGVLLGIIVFIGEILVSKRYLILIAKWLRNHRKIGKSKF